MSEKFVSKFRFGSKPNLPVLGPRSKPQGLSVGSGSVVNRTYRSWDREGFKVYL